jgi:acyl carrier protein
MHHDRPGIQRYIEGLLRELANDWEYEGEITPATRLFADLGYESLDVVILGTAIQEHYERAMPFAELLAAIGERELRDLTIGELVAFVDQHLQTAPVVGSTAETA